VSRAASRLDGSTRGKSWVQQLCAIPHISLCAFPALCISFIERHREGTVAINGPCSHSLRSTCLRIKHPKHPMSLWRRPPSPWAQFRHVTSITLSKAPRRHKRTVAVPWTPISLQSTDKYPLSVELREHCVPAGTFGSKTTRRKATILKTQIVSPGLCGMSIPGTHCR